MFNGPRAYRQRGVVLFFALVALVAMSLAAVALIRSVDTSTIIAGNLAFRQSTTSAGDSGIESAMSWLSAIQSANSNLNVLLDSTHPFNTTDSSARPGYYSNVANLDISNPMTCFDPRIDDIDPTNDSDPRNCRLLNDDAAIDTDGNGNKIRYLIERMCRNADQVPSIDHCLFSSAVQDNFGQNIPLPQEVCTGAGCPVAGQAPQLRITVRTQGPRNTVSYVQAFVY
ncbi:MAG: hypothetical protein KJ850_00645 [Gammaproteobacteria bacterium]|nr:hypothetical protein [Gammaproteobacteria bacterium]MBU1623529.1 hypothetical protein [Gammaproteobacteria bacterium]